MYGIKSMGIQIPVWTKNVQDRIQVTHLALCSMNMNMKIKRIDEYWAVIFKLMARALFARSWSQPKHQAPHRRPMSSIIIARWWVVTGRNRKASHSGHLLSSISLLFATIARRRIGPKGSAINLDKLSWQNQYGHHQHKPHATDLLRRHIYLQ